MTRITFNIFKKRIEEGQYHFYDKPSEFCYFPFINEEIDMITLSNEINKYGQFLNHKESFIERKTMAETNIQWINFAQTLKKEHNYTCDLSGFTYKDVKKLSHDIFGLKFNETWVNSWLIIHHMDDQQEYECYDKNKLLVLNRAVHLIKHRYNNLIKDFPSLEFDYKLWFELGSLIPDRNGEYPWRNIVTKDD